MIQQFQPNTKKNWKQKLKIYMNVHSSTIHIFKKVDAIQMSNN